MGTKIRKMKITNECISLAIAILFFVISGVCYGASDVIEKNGYRVALKWKKSGNKLIIDGMIKEGKPCKNLEISTAMRSDKGGYAHFVNTMNYQILSGMKFRNSDNYYSSEKFSSNKDWRVSGLNIRCEK